MGPWRMICTISAGRGRVHGFAFDDQPAAFCSDVWRARCMCSARSSRRRVMMMESAWDMPVRAFVACMEHVWDIAHDLACGLPDIASDLAGLPQRKHEWHLSIAQRCRIEKSVDGGGIRRLRSLHTRHEPRQRMAKRQQAFAWSEGKVEVPEHHSVIPLS